MDKSFFELLEIIFLQDSKLPCKMAEIRPEKPNFGMKTTFFQKVQKHSSRKSYYENSGRNASSKVPKTLNITPEKTQLPIVIVITNSLFHVA